MKVTGPHSSTLIWIGPMNRTHLSLTHSKAAAEFVLADICAQRRDHLQPGRRHLGGPPRRGLSHRPHPFHYACGLYDEPTLNSHRPSRPTMPIRPLGSFWPLCELAPSANAPPLTRGAILDLSPTPIFLSEERTMKRALKPPTFSAPGAYAKLCGGLR